jgi:hypothetical protein
MFVVGGEKRLTCLKNIFHASQNQCPIKVFACLVIENVCPEKENAYQK